MDEENPEQQDNEQFDLNMDEEQFGPQRIDQSFIPDDWILSCVDGEDKQK